MQSLFDSKTKKKSLGKRGTVADPIPVMLYMFAFGMSVIVAFTVYNGLIDAGFFSIMNSSAGPSANITNFQNNADTAFTALDVMSIFVFVGTAIAALLGALLIRTHPAFFFISIIVLLIEVLISVALSNTWDAMITNVNFNDSLAQFPITNFFLGNLPVIVLVTIILLAIVLYALNPFGV